MFHVRDDFRPGTKIFSIPLSWFRSVARFINSLCPGTGIRMTFPAEPSAETPVKISIDEKYLENAVRRLVPGADAGGGAQYSAGDGIDEEELKHGKIAVDDEKVVMVIAAESATTVDGNTASGAEETLDNTEWTAGGASSLTVAEFTRAKEVTVGNVYYYRLFWRLKTYNPNGTVASMSAEQGYIQVRRL